MDMSQLNMQDPQIQALLAEYMRKQQAAPPPGAAPQQTPLGPQAPAGPSGAPPVAQAVQAPLQSGPAAGGPPGAPPGGGAGMPGGQLDPNMVNAVLGLEGQEGQRDSLARQYKLADAMRAQGMQGLQQRIIPSSTGGMVVAPSLASGLAAVGSGYMADRRSRQADEAGGKLDTQRRDAKRGYFDTLTGQMRKRDPRDDMGGWGSLSDY